MKLENIKRGILEAQQEGDWEMIDFWLHCFYDHLQQEKNIDKMYKLLKEEDNVQGNSRER